MYFCISQGVFFFSVSFVTLVSLDVCIHLCAVLLFEVFIEHFFYTFAFLSVLVLLLLFLTFVCVCVICIIVGCGALKLFLSHPTSFISPICQYCPNNDKKVILEFVNSNYLRRNIF